MFLCFINIYKLMGSKVYPPLAAPQATKVQGYSETAELHNL